MLYIYLNQRFKTPIKSIKIFLKKKKYKNTNINKNNTSGVLNRAAGAASASIGRCRSLYASRRGPDAFLNLKVSLRPQFPFLWQGVASTSTFTTKLIDIDDCKIFYKNISSVL
jgi:hypothetical protein